MYHHTAGLVYIVLYIHFEMIRSCCEMFVGFGQAAKQQ